MEEFVPALFHEMFGDPITNPKHIKVVTLKDACLKITDGTHVTPTYTAKGIPFLRVTDIQSDEIDWNSVKHIPHAEYVELIRRVKPEKGDILYSKNGTIGVAKEITWDIPFAHFVSLALLKPNHDIFDSTFLTAFLNTPFALHQAKEHSKTGTVTNLHLVEINKIRVPCPCMPIQREFTQRMQEAREIQTR
jgi:type I restriction enzyme S subunit